MKRLIVGSIQALSTIIIVLLLISGLIIGAAAGYQHGAAAAVIGALLGLIASYVSACLIFGALFILLDIDDSLRAIRGLLERQGAAKA
ncbi:MAG: hypothetical protein ACHQRJ_13545 [Alphaproteobacteria bacterium]